MSYILSVIIPNKEKYVNTSRSVQYLQLSILIFAVKYGIIYNYNIVIFGRKKMRRLISAAVIIITLTALFTAAGITANAAQRTDTATVAQSAKASFSGATSISVNNSYSPYISGTMKYYYYTPSSSGYHTLYATGGGDSMVYIYDSDGNRLDYDDDDGDGLYFSLTYYMSAGTKYYIGVRFYNSSNYGYIYFNFHRIYTITYNANGGSGAPSSQQKEYNDGIYLSSSTPYRTGYTFKGWSTSSTATSASYSPGDYFTSNGDITLYAVWESTYTVLTANNSYSVYLSSGSSKQYSFTPQTSGYYVIYSTGSYDTIVYLYNNSGSQIASNDQGGESNNFRLSYYLTAGQTYQYKVKFYYSSGSGTINFKFGHVYTITYNANGGSGAPSSQEKDYGKSITLSSTTPTKSGTTFKGWAQGISSNTVAYRPGDTYSTEADLNLYALWNQNLIIASISVNTTPTKTTYYIGDTLDTSGLSVKVAYNNGSSDIIYSGFSTSGYSASTTGIKTITVSYEGRTTTFSVTVNAPSISLTPTSVSILSGNSTTLTATTTPQNMSVSWSTTNSSVASVSGGTITARQGGTATITASFTYNGTVYKAVSSVKVRAPIAIEITKLPTKTTYYIGDSATVSGMELLVTYSDGSTSPLSRGFSTKGIDTTTAGYKSATIDYGGCTATFDINVKTPTVTITNPGNGTLIATTDPEGQTVTWSSSNSSVASINSSTGKITEKKNGYADITAAMTYNGARYTTTYKYEVGMEVQSISINTMPTKTTYYIGDSLNTSGMVITVKYTSGSSNTYSSGFTTSGFSSSSAGTKTVTVLYGDKTVTFNVTVKKPVITVSEYANITMRNGTTLSASTDPSGQSISWKSNNTSIVTVSSDGKLTPKGTGSTTVTASFTYNGTTYSKSCTVTVMSPSTITITGPTKKTYYIGDSLDTSGLTVTARYTDGTKETLTASEYTLSGFSSTSSGSKNVSVSYGGKSTTFTATIKTPAVTKIEETSRYKLTATTDPAGQSVSWKSNNSNVATITSSGVYTLKNEGSAIITASFTYNGKTYSKTYNITINPEVRLTSISISSKPSNTTYYIGDTLNTTGMKLKLNYSNGNTDIVSEGFTTSYSFTAAGSSRIDVEYMGLKTNFNVTVKKPNVKLSHSELSVYPNRSTTITATTDPAGGSVTWVSSNPEVASVANGKIYTYKEGSAKITAKFNYNGKDYTYTCTVNVVEQSVLVNPFSDVAQGVWYTEAVLWCNSNAYITGTSATTFAPNTNLTRAMFVNILARIAGADTSNYGYAGFFSDAKANAWYTPAIEWAYANGLANGTGNGKFSPNASVTREQLARFFHSYAQYCNYESGGTDDLGRFKDASKVSEWALESVKWAIGNGLITGMTEDTIVPRGTATRAQAALIFKRFVETFVFG